MNYNAEHFLRLEMAAYDLSPRVIVWDGDFHNLPGAGKKPSNRSAWYQAFADRMGCRFGDFSTGLEVHWKANRQTKPTRAERKEWVKERKAHREKVAEKKEAARRQALKIWKRADRDASQHPYLANKGIKSEPGMLRVSRKVTFEQDGDDDITVAAGLLLVPMYVGKQLVNVQRIWPNGRKLYWTGTAHEASLTIGTDLWDETTNRRIYVCEGWATGWSISQATKRAVIVAFSAPNLLPVARLVRKKFGDELPLTICADNDRWTEIKHRDGPIPNPGVHLATIAAEETGAALAIPDFDDLAGNPTDFDGLRRSAGLDEVRRWLKPSSVDEAATVAVKTPDTPADMEEEGGDGEAGRDAWTEDAPFRCLGVKDGTYYYLPSSYGHMVEIHASGMGNRANMFRLCDRPEWWKRHFPSPRGDKVDWEEARAACMRVCHSEGMYDRDRVRGRGCWSDEDGNLVMHLGDRLLPPDKRQYVSPEDFAGRQGRVYIREARMAGPSRTAIMKLDEAQDILDMFKTRAWADKAAGTLLAGWVVLAPFGGALTWRPHVWVTGTAGSGKTTIVRDMVKPLLSGMIVAPGDDLLQGDTTEAAIRQELKHDSLPVVIDEMGKNTARAKGHIRGVLSLMRSASSGGVVAKGTRGGTSMRFRVQSMFLLSSISVGLGEESDKSRVAVLGLQSPATMNADKRRLEWIDFQQRIRTKITTAAARWLVARTTSWFRDGRYAATIAVTNAAAALVLSDQRAADQYGTLCAGAWMLKSDEVPSQDSAVHWMKEMDLASCIDEKTAGGIQILDFLLQQKVPVRDGGAVKEFAIRELLDAIIALDPLGTKKGPVSANEAEATLKRCGIKMLKDEFSRKYSHLMIANGSEWVADRMKDTGYSDGWLRILRNVKGAMAGKPAYFYSKLRSSRTTIIPLSSIV